MKTKINLYTKVALLLLLSVFIMMLIYISILYYSNRNKEINTLYHTTHTSVERLANNLSTPLWQYNDEMIDKVINQEMTNEYLLAIAIYNEYNNLLQGKIRIDNTIYSMIGENEYGLDESAFYKAMSQIIYEEEVLGSIVIYVTDKQINQTLINDISKLIIIYAFITAFTLLYLYLTIKFVILDPLYSLVASVDNFADMNFSVRAKIKSNDEIGFLSKRFNYMAKSIEKYNTQLIDQIFTDSLTRLPNRDKLISDLEKNMFAKPLLFIINIDGFQEINDFYGNEIGDYVLIAISRRLLECNLEYKYTLYKMQSDEYVFIIENFQALNLNNAIHDIVTNHIVKKITVIPIVVDDLEIHIRISIGIADSTTIINKQIELLQHGNMALKKAKRMKRRYIIYDESFQLKKQYESNILKANLLKWALNHNCIVPYYQPIVNNQTGKIEKYECLCRLINREGEVISPFHFLEVAKQTGYYPLLTKEIVTKSFMLFNNYDYEFSINLSVLDICDPDTIKFIKDMLISYKNISRNVVFEIIESEGIENYNEIKTFIDLVKDLGCKIAIDDFGSGYSNFENVLKLNIDYLKIDSTLIKNIDNNTDLQIVTRTIVNFSRELNIQTIAEYVHSEQVLAKVKELMIDFSQGYYLGEPKNDLCK